MAQNKKPMKDRVPFDYPVTKIADKAAYVVWKDSKVVLFYTNDLAATPSQPIMEGTERESIACVNGLAQLSRWTGEEILDRTTFYILAIIVACNIFMSAVDCMDHLRSTNSAK